jgi:hypothetical protein
MALLTGTNNGSENTVNDGDFAAESHPYRLSTHGDGSMGLASLALAVATQAAAWNDKAGDIRNDLLQYARAGMLAEKANVFSGRKRLPKFGQPAGVVRPR